MNPNTSAALSSRDNESGFFIDDYSQLRLSYYQQRDNDSLGTSEDFSRDTSGLSSDTVETDLENCEDTIDTEKKTTTLESDKSVPRDSKTLMEDERQRLREYYISQIPDFPHPAITMASIIASASNKMGSQFKYNDRIEQGPQKVEVDFSPQRRSTLMPKPKTH